MVAVLAILLCGCGNEGVVTKEYPYSVQLDSGEEFGFGIQFKYSPLFDTSSEVASYEQDVINSLILLNKEYQEEFITVYAVNNSDVNCYRVPFSNGDVKFYFMRYDGFTYGDIDILQEYITELNASQELTIESEDGEAIVDYDDINNNEENDEECNLPTNESNNGNDNQVVEDGWITGLAFTRWIKDSDGNSFEFKLHSYAKDRFEVGIRESLYIDEMYREFDSYNKNVLDNDIHLYWYFDDVIGYYCKSMYSNGYILYAWLDDNTVISGDENEFNSYRKVLEDRGVSALDGLKEKNKVVSFYSGVEVTMEEVAAGASMLSTVNTAASNNIEYVAISDVYSIANNSQLQEYIRKGLQVENLSEVTCCYIENFGAWLYEKNSNGDMLYFIISDEYRDGELDCIATIIPNSLAW